MNHKRENRDSVKSINIAIAVTPGENEEIVNMARKLGISRSEYVRRKVFGERRRFE